MAFVGFNAQHSLFTDAAPPASYSLSLHDALPILNSLMRAMTRDDVPPSPSPSVLPKARSPSSIITTTCPMARITFRIFSDRKSTRLNSRLAYLVCRLLPEKKNVDHEHVGRSREDGLRRIQCSAFFVY